MKYRVDMHRVDGTDAMIFVAYEPATYESHLTTIRYNGMLLGEVGSRRYPGDKFADTMDHVNAVRKWYSDNANDAARIILAAFPEHNGKIEFYSLGQGIMSDLKTRKENREVEL